MRHSGVILNSLVIKIISLLPSLLLLFKSLAGCLAYFFHATRNFENIKTRF